MHYLQKKTTRYFYLFPFAAAPIYSMASILSHYELFKQLSRDYYAMSPRRCDLVSPPDVCIYMTTEAVSQVATQVTHLSRYPLKCTRVYPFPFGLSAQLRREHS